MKPHEYGLVFHGPRLRYFKECEEGQDKQGFFLSVLFLDGTRAKIRQSYSRKLERVIEPAEFVHRYPGKEGEEMTDFRNLCKWYGGDCGECIGEIPPECFEPHKESNDKPPQQSLETRVRGE